MGFFDKVRERFSKKSDITSEDIGMKHDIMSPERLNPAYRDMPENPGNSDIMPPARPSEKPARPDTAGMPAPDPLASLGLPGMKSSDIPDFGGSRQHPGEPRAPLPPDRLGNIGQLLEVIRSQNELILQKLNLIEQSLRNR